MTDTLESVTAEITDTISKAMKKRQDNSPRSLLARHGYLGASDMGFCRQKAKLVTTGTTPTDNPPKWSAFVGTAVGKEIELALHALELGWYIGSVGNLEVTAKFPSGVEMGGHPDIVAPDLNAVLDIKTVDGFEWVKREGTSLQHKYQRHIYALGCIQKGILDDTKPVYVGNLYFDRSGKQPDPIIIVEEMDYTLTAEIDSWIQDVIYAVKQGEDAPRDVAAPVCERICEFFTVCRGALETRDGGEKITDGMLLTAIDMYVDARNMENRAKEMKAEAAARLAGVNGMTDEWQVRWTHVNPTVVQQFERPGHSRIDIRAVRKR